MSSLKIFYKKIAILCKIHLILELKGNTFRRGSFYLYAITLENNN